MIIECEILCVYRQKWIFLDMWYVRHSHTTFMHTCDGWKCKKTWTKKGPEIAYSTTYKIKGTAKQNKKIESNENL